MLLNYIFFGFKPLFVAQSMSKIVMQNSPSWYTTFLLNSLGEFLLSQVAILGVANGKSETCRDAETGISKSSPR